MVQCAGIIVLKDDMCILVKTQKNNYGFPKGKRIKNETLFETAVRELKEETNINSNQIIIAQDCFLDEVNRNNYLSVRYLIAKYIDINNCDIKFDHNELEEVNWYNINDALNLLTIKNRKQILQNAIEIVNNEKIKFS